MFVCRQQLSLIATSGRPCVRHIDQSLSDSFHSLTHPRSGSRGTPCHPTAFWGSVTLRSNIWPLLSLLVSLILRLICHRRSSRALPLSLSALRSAELFRVRSRPSEAIVRHRPFTQTLLAPCLRRSRLLA